MNTPETSLPGGTPVRSNRIVGLRDQWPPNMTMRGWMRWQENRWKMHDRQVAWIREQKAYAAQSNKQITDK
jgi:hypothetical protein